MGEEHANSTSSVFSIGTNIYIENTGITISLEASDRPTCETDCNDNILRWIDRSVLGKLIKVKGEI